MLTNASIVIFPTSHPYEVKTFNRTVLKCPNGYFGITISEEVVEQNVIKSLCCNFDDITLLLLKAG